MSHSQCLLILHLLTDFLTLSVEDVITVVRQLPDTRRCREGLEQSAAMDSVISVFAPV